MQTQFAARAVVTLVMGMVMMASLAACGDAGAPSSSAQAEAGVGADQTLAAATDTDGASVQFAVQETATQDAAACDDCEDCELKPATEAVASCCSEEGACCKEETKPAMADASCCDVVQPHLQADSGISGEILAAAGSMFQAADADPGVKLAGDGLPACCVIEEEAVDDQSAPAPAVPAVAEAPTSTEVVTEDVTSEPVAAAPVTPSTPLVVVDTSPTPTAAAAPASTEAPTGEAAAMPVDAAGQIVADSTGMPARASDWIEPANRQRFVLDYSVENQDGKVMKVSDILDRPVAMSFIFTRCSDPKMCPMIVVNMAHVQRELEKLGLSDQATLAMVTYDPIYDTPERLKKYGADRGVRFDNAVMLRPSNDDFRPLFTELAVTVQPYADGTVAHRMELILMDRQGRFVRDYAAGHWNARDVAMDLKRLAEEPVDEADASAAIEPSGASQAKAAIAAAN